MLRNFWKEQKTIQTYWLTMIPNDEIKEVIIDKGIFKRNEGM